MSTTRTGGPAFPVGEKWTERDSYGGTQTCSKGALHNGMTLLDHFAGQALRLPDVRFASLFSFRWASRIAYVHAAAMIAERERIMNAE